MANITKRGDTYRIRGFAGYDAKGKQLVKSVTWRPAPGMTKKQIEKEVSRQAFLLDEQIRTGQYISGKIKFHEFAEIWFRDYAVDHLREKTYNEYLKRMPRINAEVGNICLEKLQPQHLVQFYKKLSLTGVRRDNKYLPAVDVVKLMDSKKIKRAELASAAAVDCATITAIRKGRAVNERSAGKVSAALGMEKGKLFKPANADKPLSGKTILHYHSLISSILDRAVKWQIIRENPCARIDAPKDFPHEIKCLNEKQAVKLLEALEREAPEDRLLFTLALYTGMRRGELLGLEWPDIDFNSGVITVRRTSQYEEGLGTYTTGTKTERSKRSIKVPQNVVELLKEYREHQTELSRSLGDLWKHSLRIFVGKYGAPLNSNLPRQHLVKILERVGLPQVSFHSLRHTNATLLIQQGINIRAVSGRLGHSQTSTTMNIYAHQLQSADAAASAALDIVLSRK